MGLLVSLVVAIWLFACGYCGFRGQLRGFVVAMFAGLLPLAGLLLLILGAGPGELVFAHSLASAFLMAVASGLTGLLLVRLAQWRRS